MTTYWQQFKECIDHLQITKGDEQYSKQIKTAISMIEIGLTIEELGITEIKQVVNKLQEKAKSFENEVSFTADKKYQFNLPKITNTESLIFAIIYYQHLKNYEGVSYQGSINWFKQLVIDRINEKKITTRIQCQAMLMVINHYCKQQNMAINESQFVKNTNELSKDYIKRISQFCSLDKDIKIEKEANNEEKISNQIGDEISRLEKVLDDLLAKKNQLKIKCNTFFTKLNAFEQTKKKYNILDYEWQNKWVITKFFYRLISWFYTAPLIKKLILAKQEMNQAENELNQELPPKTVESYRHELRQQLEEINSECEKTLEQIDLQIAEQEKQQQIKLQESKQQNIQIEQPEPTDALVMADTQKSFVTSDEPDSNLKIDTDNSQSDLNYYYGFFKENLPSKYAMRAIAVGAAAIVIQNLAYS